MLDVVPNILFSTELIAGVTGISNLSFFKGQKLP